MKRSLRRHIWSAVNETWGKNPSYNAGTTGVLLTFGPDAFADAPVWSPGADFELCTDWSWLRSNGDGTATAVVAGVGPKERPALDGGEWTEPEVWTVTADEETLRDTSSLWDKPHRISWMLDVEGAQVHREPYDGHPAAAVHRFWEEFEQTWGFRPRQRGFYGDYPLGRDKSWLMLSCVPGVAHLPNEVDLLRASLFLARKFNAKARVYSWNPGRQQLNGPLERLDYIYSPELARVAAIARAEQQH